MNWILIQFQVLATWMSLHATTAYVSTMVSGMTETMTVVIIVMKQAIVSYY